MALALPSVGTAQAATRALAPDSATILVSLLARPVGTETYVVRDAGRGSRLTAAVRLVDRGTPLSLDATLDVGPDLAPTRFSAKGRSYRFVNVETDVVLAGDSAVARDRGITAKIRPIGATYVAQGWPPLSARALLVRYWERHRRPPSIRLLPGPDTHAARIDYRGTDTVQVGGRATSLRRYAVDGVVWGRETVWLDEQDRFAAIVTRIHILPMEGVRADLAAVLPELQRSAIADRVDDMRRVARDVLPTASGDFAVQGVRIIDGTGRRPINDATILVRNGRISQVAERAVVDIPGGMRVVDGRGKTAIPGLWDMHAHASQVEWAPAYLAAGVTTIRDMGGEEPFLRAFRTALADGAGVGPRVLLAGLVDGDDSAAFGAVTAATPAEGRAVVERFRAAGYDQVKLYSMLRPEVVGAIVARAHDLGMRVTGHVPRSLGIRPAIDAGMDEVAHIPVSGDTASREVRDVIAALAAHPIVVDPTIPWNELLGRAPTTPIERFEPGIRGAPPALAANYRSVANPTDSAGASEALRRQLAVIRAMHDAGIPIVAGTDGAVPGHSLLRSLELFVQAGFTPMEAIQSASLVAARAMGMEGDSGTLEVGKRADFVVLDADPLDDIANVRRTRWVVRDGRMFDPGALWRAAGWTP